MKGTRSALVVSCIVLLLALVPAQATDGTWSNGAGGLWDTPGNWLGNNIADGPGATAAFNTLNISGTRVISLNSSHTIGTLLFGDATTPDSDWILSTFSGSTLTLSGSPIINVVNRTLTISLSLAGVEGMEKLGPGTNILSGANSFSGGTTISEGTLRISSDSHLGMVPSSPEPAHLVVNGGVFSASASMALNPNRGIALGSPTTTGDGTIEVISVQAVTLTINGVVTDNGFGSGSLVKSGAGRLSLGGANTYSGNTRILGGPLQITSDANLGAVPAVATPGSIVIIGAQLAVNATMTLNSKRGIAIGPSSGFGLGQLDVASPFVLRYDGIISDNGSGIGTLIKSGIGTLVLGGVNTYSGSTAIQNGANFGGVRLAANNVIPDGAGKGDVNVGLGSILDLAGFSDTINGLTGGGIITNSTGNGSLTVGNNDVTSQFNGVITNASGSLALTKIGTGTLTLSGANTYTGGTTISGGTVQIGPANGTSGSIIGNVLNNGNLVFYRNNTLTFSGNISGSGTVVQNGGSVLTLSGNSSYSGPTFVNAGAVQVGSVNALGDALGQTEVAEGASITFPGVAFTLNEPFKIAGFGFGTASAAIDAQSGSSVTLSGAVTLAADSKVTVATGSSMTFSHASAFTSLADQNLTLAGTGAGSVQGIIALGSGSLIKTNSGTWTLSGANTYSGNTLIVAGTLALSGFGAIASSATIAVSNGATFNVSGVSGGFHLASGQTLKGAGTNNGNVTIAGGATLSPGSSRGTLTFNNALTLGGNAIMEINRNGGVFTSDLVVVGGLLTYGGTLTVVATGDTLMEGNTFHLFNAMSFAGSFAASNLPALPPCLFWDTSMLPVDGTIKVVTIPVAIICPGPIGMNICDSSVDVSYANPTVNGGTLVGCTPPSGTSFGAGVTPVTCVATNLCATNSCSFNVTVVQITALAMTCPANISTNTCGPDVVATFAPVISGGTLSACVPPSGSGFALGTTPVNCTATNLCSTNSCSFDVIVDQSVDFAMVCPATFSTSICGPTSPVTYPEPTISGGILAGCVPANGSAFGVGTTTVTCTATNLCGTNTCSFDVMAASLPELAITCPANISMNICGSSVAITYDDPTVTGGNLRECTPASGSTFNLGTTTVTCTATNLCSTNPCSFDVTVQSIAALTLTCPASITTNICGASIEVNYTEATAIGGTVIGCTPASGTTFAAGTTPVTCTATNFCLTNICSFDVTVVQVTAPSISCPGDVSTNICGSSVAVSYVGPTFSGGTMIGCLPTSGSAFGLGTTPVICTVTNLCSTNACSFNVTVAPIAALSMTCPANVSTNICDGNVAVSFANPTVSGGILTGCAPTSGSTFSLGTTPVTCTATNLCSTNLCTFNVAVTQLAALALTCPANVSTNICSSSVAVSYADPTVTGGTVTGCSPASGSNFSLGTTPVTCTATNFCSTNTCSFNVSVQSIAALSMTCPANVSTNICDGNVAVSFPNPSVSGGSSIGCTPASGSSFSLGTTTVTCTSTNLCSTNTCSFDVTVSQIAALSITCPANVSTNICDGSVPVSYPNPTVSGGSLRGCSPTSGSIFSLGSTPVTCTATNLCSTNTCSFNVAVTQIAALSIACPANVATNICGTTAPVGYASPTVSGGTLKGCTPTSGSTFVLGTTPVTCTATNLCSTNTCSFNVAITQIAALAITCPSALTTNVCGTSAAVSYANPNVTGGTLRDCTPTSGSTFNLGTTPVTCTATNLCLTNSCSFNVAVAQIAALVITCPSAVSTNICGTSVGVGYANPTVSGGTLTGCAPASGSTFAVGTTPVTCTATNVCSTNTCSFNVVVAQIAELAITCPDNLSTNICGTSVTVTYANPTVSGGTLRACTPTSGSAFALGTTPVTCTATNRCSTNTCSFDVAVAQIAALTITCPAAVSTNICGTSVAAGYASPTVVGGTLRACAPTSGSTFVLGTTPVTCTATNRCSTNTCSFNVVVVQVGALTITCPSTVTTNICDTSAAVSYANPAVSGGTLRGCTPASGSTFVVGTTSVTCTGTNVCLTNTCSFNVTVTQVAALAITCPANVSTNICGTSVAVSYANPTVSGGTLRACTPASGSVFALGTTPVNCTATNLCSTNICSFDVTVAPLAPLAITCPANVSTNICGANVAVSYASPTVNGGTLRACTPASGSTFALGTTAVTCTATNRCSTNTCSFNVAVAQVSALAITCSSAITTNICGTSVAVNYASPTVSGGTLRACAPTNGSTFNLGTTPVTCSATNQCSTNTCSFNVAVVQVGALTITCPSAVSTNICGTSATLSYANATVSGGTLRGCTPTSGSTFVAGITPVTCTATNLCSTNTCSFNVTVTQIAALAITCPANASTNICGTSVAVGFASPTISGGTLRGCTPASGTTFVLGTTPVTCTATNFCSTNTCSFNVVVGQVGALTITCPSAVTTNICGTSVAVSYASPTVSGGTLRACAPASGTTFAVGTTAVTCTGTNSCSTNTCSFNVVVVRVATLVINCPSTINTNVCGTSAAINYANPTISGGTLRACLPASGSTFALGTTAVTCTATNLCSTNTCSFNVALTQITPLVMTCPANVSTNICGAGVAVSYANPTVSGGTLTGCTPVSGSTFAVGTTPVTCTSTNRCSTNTCSFNIAVTTLVITCPANVSTNICGASVAVSYASPTVGGGALRACTPASGSTFAVGTTAVTCTATNRCSTNTCSFNVAVVHGGTLAITCPSAVSTNICGTSVAVSYADPTVSDGTLRSCTPTSGSTFGLGATAVTCTGTNLCSTNTCSFNVTVVQAPLAMTCPASISTNTCDASVAVSYANPTVSSGALTDCTPPSGSPFGLGTNLVTCTATNLCSTNTCSFDVVVEIATLAMTCPTNFIANICGTSGPVHYAAPAVIGGLLMGCTPASGDIFALGITTVTCTATNRCSTNTCSFDVLATQPLPLTIGCPADFSTNSCGMVSYADPAVSGGRLAGCTPASGSMFVSGTTPVTCTATNLCSTNSCSFNVTVVELAAPLAITCPTDVSTNICGTSVEVGFTDPTVSNGTLVGCTPASGSTFVLGTTPVTCMATNLCSTNSCTFNVVVNGPTPPLLDIAQQNSIVVIKWPVGSSCAFVLEQTSFLPSLSSGSWSDVSEPVTVVSGNFTVMVPIGSANKFFRLRFP